MWKSLEMHCYNTRVQRMHAFYCKQDTVCMLPIYLLVCVHNFSFIIIIITITIIIIILSFYYFINVLCYY
jgi:hypothetical protein